MLRAPWWLCWLRKKKAMASAAPHPFSHGISVSTAPFAAPFAAYRSVSMRRVYLVAVQLAILFFIGFGLWFKSDDIKPLTWDRWRGSKPSVPEPFSPEGAPADAAEKSAWDYVINETTIVQTLTPGTTPTDDGIPSDDGHDDDENPATGEDESQSQLLPGDNVSNNPPTNDDDKDTDPITPYITSILDPSSTILPRMSCAGPDYDRYSYLQAPIYFQKPEPQELRYFFALDLRQNQALLPRLLGSLVETIRFLGPASCALSIVEGNSADLTYKILDRLMPELEEMGLSYYLRTSSLDPSEGDRIGKLAELRNLALVPLVPELDPEYSSTTSTTTSDDDDDDDDDEKKQDKTEETTATAAKTKKKKEKKKKRSPIIHRRSSGLLPPASPTKTSIVFLNDVAICPSDILELIHQRSYQEADMTCAMDWTYVGDNPTFYDVWVARTMSGNLFFDIPPGGSWDNAWDLFWKDPLEKMDYASGQPFQVYACWNGAVVFGAGPLLGEGEDEDEEKEGEEGKKRKKIEGGFRRSRENKGECFQGEPTLWCKDMWWHGYNRIAVVPSVNLEYSDEAGEKVKKLKGKVETWTAAAAAAREKGEKKKEERKIEWVDEPPSQVVCMPGLGDQSWRAWNETLG